MSEWRLFEEGTVPEWTTPEWYAGRESAPHLEQEGHRERLVLTSEFCRDAYSLGADTVVDLGAGDGGLLSILEQFMQRVGYDLQQSNVEAAAIRGVEVRLQDVVAELPELGDLVVVTEMLEHLIDPHDFVARITADETVNYVVASSPYTENDEHHYEFHTWAWNDQGYRKMFTDHGWHVLKQDHAWISQVLLVGRKP